MVTEGDYLSRVDALLNPTPTDPPPGDPPPGDPPPGDPPPADPPPAEPPNPLLDPPPTTGKFEITSEMLGLQFNTVEELQGHIKKLKAVETEKIALMQEKEELAARVASIQPVDIDADLHRLSVLKKAEKQEEFNMYSSVVFGNPSDFEILKLGFLNQHPEYKSDPSFVEAYVRDQYTVLFDPESDKESFEYKKAKLKMSDDANSVRESIKTKFSQIELPKAPEPVVHKTQEEITTEVVSQWKPVFPNIAKEFNEISIPVTDPEDPTKSVEFMKLAVPEDVKNQLVKDTAEFIIGSRMPMTEENVQVVKSMLINGYVANNLSKIITTILDSVQENNSNEWRKFIHNPSIQKDGDGHRGPKKSLQQQELDKVRQQYPGG